MGRRNTQVEPTLINREWGTRKGEKTRQPGRMHAGQRGPVRERGAEAGGAPRGSERGP
jgi:hypothetical protein